MLRPWHGHGDPITGGRSHAGSPHADWQSPCAMRRTEAEFDSEGPFWQHQGNDERILFRPRDHRDAGAVIRHAAVVGGYRFFIFLLPIWGFFFGFGLGAQAVQALFGDAFLSTVTS